MVKEKVNKLKHAYKTKHVVLGKVKIGMPGSESYKAKTPKKLKTVGETMVFVGSAVALLAGGLTLPGWLVMAGGLSTLTGRFFIKMFSYNN